MQGRRRGYTAYGVSSALVWLVVLTIANHVAEESRRRTIRVVCAGWWLGWLSATIAPQVYPPPRRWRMR